MTPEILARLEYIASIAPPSPEWWTVRQVADHRGKHVKTVQQWVADGKIPSRRRGRTIEIHRDHINQAV